MLLRALGTGSHCSPPLHSCMQSLLLATAGEGRGGEGRGGEGRGGEGRGGEGREGEGRGGEGRGGEGVM